MLRRIYPVVFFVLSAMAASPPVYAQSVEDPYSIMRPEPTGKTPRPVEPWLPPKYKSPRGTRQHVSHPRPAETRQLRAQTPPPVVVPETGRVLPNLPVLPGAGPSGVETGQDRASRCAFQAGTYGAAAGDRNTYINTCINQ
jgi:hypothetical protein